MTESLLTFERKSYNKAHLFQAPLTLELLGTAHSETVKPAVLEMKHLEQFRRHTDRGLTMFPPEHLNELLAQGKLQLDDKNTLMDPQVKTCYSSKLLLSADTV